MTSAHAASSTRLDIFRRENFFLCVARREPEGSIALLHHGELPGLERHELGEHVLSWLQRARATATPATPLRFPDDLLPPGWQADHWFDFMSHADLCTVESLEVTRDGASRSEKALRIRSYKNLSPVGEEFSHEGDHSLLCSEEPRSVGGALNAALDISQSMSRIAQSPAFETAQPRLDGSILEELSRLGARLYERPAQTEVIETPEGFFLLPAALRQLLFDVVWPRATRLQAVDGRRWQVRWFPLDHQPRLRQWPLVVLADRPAEADPLRHLVLIRLDDPSPDDPQVYVLEASHEPSAVLGSSEREASPSGPADDRRLSRWLRSLAPAPPTGNDES